MNLIILTLLIFVIAILMTLTGRGGGNFYVLALVLSGFSMQQSASTGQFILFISSISATLIFGKGKNIEWKLVLVIGSITAISAFFGGYFSQYFSGKILKFVFSFFLLIASLLMFLPVKKKKITEEKKSGIWNLKSNGNEYQINLKLALPLIIATGFGAGMVGVSGGSFLVPLMVLTCGIPMNLAVGTSTTMVAGTSLMGFIGHVITGDFIPETGIILAIAASIGGIIGGRFALKTKPKVLKIIFAFTSLIASILMVFNALMSSSKQG
jgi:uncharacterized membrane protein YfcA